MDTKTASMKLADIGQCTCADPANDGDCPYCCIAAHHDLRIMLEATRNNLFEASLRLASLKHLVILRYYFYSGIPVDTTDPNQVAMGERVWEDHCNLAITQLQQFNRTINGRNNTPA